MNNQTLLESTQSLSSEDRAKLISVLTELGGSLSEKIPSPPLEELLNKQVDCLHCEEKHYYRYGQDKGS